ncbi:peptidoglycan DD-metalloendopeptidase family protein [Candidatus Parcubacteria bacterium]|nr:peptidoglycan DD-metalloendopeptidase family protein [Candidatus Parcubacteria bacterium]
MNKSRFLPLRPETSERIAALFLAVSFFIFATILSNLTPVYAISEELEVLLKKSIFYYDPTCSPVESRNSGNDADSAKFPSLSEEDMAEAINEYMKKTNPKGKLNGLGSTIVAGAKNSNVSPFLIVAIAQKESGLGDPNFGDGFNVREANNSFGRSATQSQPNAQGSRLWYKWSSIRASVDHTARENKNAAGGGDIAAYIRKQYPEELDKSNLEEFFKKYAPDFENDTAQYIEDVKKWTGEMIELTKQGSGDGEEVQPESGSNSLGADCACGASGEDSASLGSGTNAKKAYTYLTSPPRSLSPKAASAIVGNLMLESGNNTENLSTTIEAPSTGAHGIAQWAFERKTELYKRGGQTSLTKQLGFLWYEINDPKGQASAGTKPPYALYNGPMKDKPLIEIFKSDLPLDKMTIAFEQIFERSGVLGKRVQNAIKIYEKYGGSSPGGSGGECPSGSGSGSGNFVWPVKDKKYGSQGGPGMCWAGPRAGGRKHGGLDIGALGNTNLKALAADGGKVESASVEAGFGNNIVIDHGKGLWSQYSHLASMDVKKGDTVDQGQPIGIIGGTGGSYPVHLHFQIEKKGGVTPSQAELTENPLNHLPEDGRPLGVCKKGNKGF